MSKHCKSPCQQIHWIAGEIQHGAWHETLGAVPRPGTSGIFQMGRETEEVLAAAAAADYRIRVLHRGEKTFVEVRPEGGSADWPEKYEIWSATYSLLQRPKYSCLGPITTTTRRHSLGAKDVEILPVHPGFNIRSLIFPP